MKAEAYAGSTRDVTAAVALVEPAAPVLLRTLPNDETELSLRGSYGLG